MDSDTSFWRPGGNPNAIPKPKARRGAGSLDGFKYRRRTLTKSGAKRPRLPIGDHFVGIKEGLHKWRHVGASEVHNMPERTDCLPMNLTSMIHS